MAAEAAAAEALEVRELTGAEIQLLATVPPFDQVGLGERDRDRVRVIGALRGGKVVAYWMMYDAVHVEPLWIAPEERGNPAIARPLWTKVVETLVEVGTPMAYAMIGDGALEQNAPMALRLGFRPLSGNLFYILLAK